MVCRIREDTLDLGVRHGHLGNARLSVGAESCVVRPGWIPCGCPLGDDLCLCVDVHWHGQYAAAPAVHGLPEDGGASHLELPAERLQFCCPCLDGVSSRQVARSLCGDHVCGGSGH